MIGKKLDDVPDEHSFKLKSGKQVKNLYELALDLAGMDDETFQHHVNDEKNDFRSWILEIVNDEHLADKLSKVKDRKKMANTTCLSAGGRRMQKRVIWPGLNQR